MNEINITWKDIDQLEVRRKNGENIYYKLSENKNLVNHNYKAKLWGTVSRYDDTYLVYYYQYKNVKYIFGWVTPYDETHRGYSSVKSHTWYDLLSQNEFFNIKINKKNAKQHYISSKKCIDMNNGVYFLGEQ